MGGVADRPVAAAVPEEACTNGAARADWLNALIYEMTTRRMLFARFEVHSDGLQLVASARGEAVDAVRHRPAVEVKGATYTALRVAREDGHWVAQTVVDV